MTRPERMRFIDMTGTGGPEVLPVAEGLVPQPGNGETLIRVAAAGVNRPDVVQRSGSYPPPPGALPVPRGLGLMAAAGLPETFFMESPLPQCGRGDRALVSAPPRCFRRGAIRRRPARSRSAGATGP